MSLSDSDSALSTPPATDDEMPVDIGSIKTKKPAPPKKKKKKNGTILSFFEKEPASPPRKKRAPSPPHEPVPEDNPDIAFIIIFRSRFADAFPPRCPHLGPQDLEQGVAEEYPSPQIEGLLCALLGLVLNRKKPVEKGHYGRALDEAIQTQKSQWPRSWGYINPLHGGRSFNSMAPSERLNLLKTLVLWSLNQSEAVNNMIKEAYKARTTKDKADTNIPLSVQPWGRDGDKRRYWLIEGKDDTAFRIYRESNPALKNVAWWSVAGSIDELRVLAKKLEEEDGTREAKSLSERMLNAIPRFEATEEKRKRRDYRLARKAAFLRPEPGFSLYEGRTRGKRMRYTFSDEEFDLDSDGLSTRRSARNSGRETPAAPAGPTVTASGRQVRSRATGMYGESLLSGQTTEGASPGTGDYERSDASEEPEAPTHGRSTRAANKGQAVNGWGKGRKHIETYNSLDEMDDEDDATSWDGGDEEEDEPDHMHLDDDEDDAGDRSSDEEREPKSLIVRLQYRKDPTNASAPVSEVKEEYLVQPKQAVESADVHIAPPSAGVIAPLQTAPVPAPSPAPPPALVPEKAPEPVQVFEPVAHPSNSSIASPGVQTAEGSTSLPPIVPAAQPPAPTNTLPKLENIFPNPTPSYTTQEESKPHQPPPFASTLSAGTPASSWQ